jgi:hypothetical protein
LIFSFVLRRGTLGGTMAARKLTLTAIRRVASALSGVQEGTSYGTPAWRHKGRLLARLHQDGESLMLKVGFEAREHLVRADPKTFFVRSQEAPGPSDRAPVTTRPA